MSTELEFIFCFVPDENEVFKVGIRQVGLDNARELVYRILSHEELGTLASQCEGEST
jgi:hypothetical protein